MRPRHAAGQTRRGGQRSRASQGQWRQRRWPSGGGLAAEGRVADSDDDDNNGGAADDAADDAAEGLRDRSKMVSYAALLFVHDSDAEGDS